MRLPRGSTKYRKVSSPSPSNTKKCFKLVRMRKDGSLGPLFIDPRMRYQIGKWHQAQSVPTKGFALRPGFHVTMAPIAPHLKEKEERVWCAAEMKDWEEHTRPEAQGGLWCTAQNIRVTEVLGTMLDTPWFACVWAPGQTLWARAETQQLCYDYMWHYLSVYESENRLPESPFTSLLYTLQFRGWPFLMPQKYKGT